MKTSQTRPGDKLRFLGIAACDPKGVIGKQGLLPWNCPEDIQYFKRTIAHHPLIMGYNTYVHLPKHYLQNRLVLLFTHRMISGPLIVSSWQAFMRLKPRLPKVIFYVIGGAQIYDLFLSSSLIECFSLTVLKKLYSGDAYLCLERFEGWSCHRIQDTQTFTIYHYYRPYHVRKSL